MTFVRDQIGDNYKEQRGVGHNLVARRCPIDAINIYTIVDNADFAAITALRFDKLIEYRDGVA